MRVKKKKIKLKRGTSAPYYKIAQRRDEEPLAGRQEKGEGAASRVRLLLGKNSQPLRDET